MVELPSAVIGDVNPVDAVIERDLRIFGGGDALEHQRNFELVLDQLDRAPVEPFLEIAAGRADAAVPDVALGDIALAAAVMRGVDGQAERGVAIGDPGATDHVLDTGVSPRTRAERGAAPSGAAWPSSPAQAGTPRKAYATTELPAPRATPPPPSGTKFHHARRAQAGQVSGSASKNMRRRGRHR